MNHRFLISAVNSIAISVLLLILLPASGFSQNQVIEEGLKITKAYRSANHLSFDIRYTYAKESTPLIIEDSARAHYKMHGYKYQGNMNNVVFMQNDSVHVAVYPPQQVMTLTLPADTDERSLPISQWDSLFNKGNFTYKLENGEGHKKITVDYVNLSQSPVSKFEMWYDPSTYLVNRIRYNIDETASQELVDKGIFTGTMMIVDIHFSNYKTGAFKDEVFNPANYFVKSGQDFTAVGPYENCEVHVLSAGL